jgi:putative phage-type endonuclease
MAITALQRQQRDQGVGASEVGAIMGVDPFRNAYAVWAEKTGKVHAERENDAMRWGNRLEPLIVAVAAERLKMKIVRPTGTYKRRNSVMFANVDAQAIKAVRGQPPVECKSSRVSDGWGEPGTDNVPDRVMLQVTAQMMCCEATTAYVARMSFNQFGPAFGIYPVMLNSHLAQVIEDACGSFWENHVAKDIPPQNVEPALDVVSRFVPRMGTHATIARTTAAAFVEANRIRREAEKGEETAKARLLAEMQGAEFGDCQGFEIVNSSYTQDRIDADRLRDEQPQIAATYTKPVPCRRLSVKAVGDKR